MGDFILWGLLLAISSATISLQADFWKNSLTNLRLNPLCCGCVMRESRIYEFKQVSLLRSCLPGFLFGGAHVPLTSKKGASKKEVPCYFVKEAALAASVLCQIQSNAGCTSCKVWNVWYRDPLLAIREEHVLSGHTVVSCSTCKTGGEASSRTGSLVIRRLLFCEHSFFNSCHQHSYDWLFYYFSWWIRTIKKQRMRNCVSGRTCRGGFLDQRGADLFLLQKQPVFFIMRVSDYLPSELEGQKGDSTLEMHQLTAMLVYNVFPGYHRGIPLLSSAARIPPAIRLQPRWGQWRGRKLSGWHFWGRVPALLVPSCDCHSRSKNYCG